MCGTDTREDLNLTPATEVSCACCSTGAETPAPAGASGTAYVELVTGGTSTLTVSGTAGTAAVRAAVATACYAATSK